MRHSCYLCASLRNLKSLILNVGTGRFTTLGQTDAVANVAGVHEKYCVWWAAMNMMYSDYYSVATKYGLDRPYFYADLAKAFLMDKDAGGPEEKMAGYYHGVVLRK